MDQMQLLPTLSRDAALRLHVEAVSAEQRRLAMFKAAKPERERVTSWQLDLLGEPKPIRRWVYVQRRRPGPAPKQRRVATSAFDLAAVDLRITIGKGGERNICRQVVRDGDTVRHVAIREQDTDEWAEREQQRRARQRPPRPAKSAKTRSKKLNDLIGEDE